jgi:hypothetical protein
VSPKKKRFTIGALIGGASASKTKVVPPPGNTTRTAIVEDTEQQASQKRNEIAFGSSSRSIQEHEMLL